MLTDQVAVVTGGAQGLGYAIAERFIAEGAVVVLGDLDLAATEAAGEKLGRDATLAVRCDVTKADEVDALVAAAVEHFGGLDIMVNNAGITRDATMRKMTEQQFDEVIAVHLKGTWNGTKAAAAIMRERNSGAIVNMSSISGKVGLVGQTNYSAAKAGIVGMTKAAAKELAHLGVRVNAIQPGLIRSAMTEAMPQHIWDQKLAEVPMGRRGRARRGGEGGLVPGQRSVLVHDRDRPRGHRREARVMTREAVICEPVRTPIGRYGGMFASLTAVDLGVTALKGLLDRTGIAPDVVDDVILGHCYPNSEAPAIGRVVALDAGLPVTVPGMQVDRRCGSGLQAVIQACLQVSSGDNDLVVAGGAESMSNVAFYSTDMRWGGGRSGVTVHDALARGRTTAGGQNYPVAGGMLETAENLRRQYGISREEQDELAVASHQRAVAAQKDGVLAEEIIGVTVRSRKGEQVIDTDEHPRADTSVESLAKLKPILGKDDPDATVTAGNASGQNDAASMCIVTTPEKAAELGLEPLVRLVSWGSAGVAPNIMGIGPVPSTEVALGKAGLSLSDIDLIELNEAFAAQALAVMREWGFTDADRERTNVHGSGISLGHPVGATGGRMLATLARELTRREARYGLETMCIGGGQGLAAVFERVGA